MSTWLGGDDDDEFCDEPITQRDKEKRDKQIKSKLKLTQK